MIEVVSDETGIFRHAPGFRWQGAAREAGKIENMNVVAQRREFHGDRLHVLDLVSPTVQQQHREAACGAFAVNLPGDGQADKGDCRNCHVVTPRLIIAPSATNLSRTSSNVRPKTSALSITV